MSLLDQITELEKKISESKGKSTYDYIELFSLTYKLHNQGFDDKVNIPIVYKDIVWLDWREKGDLIDGMLIGDRAGFCNLNCTQHRATIRLHHQAVNVKKNRNWIITTEYHPRGIVCTRVK